MVALIAASIAAVIAWFMTRSSDPARPGWAVRIYLELFRASGWRSARDAATVKSTFPRREAYLATWFLVFFALFLAAAFFWPAASGHL